MTTFPVLAESLELLRHVGAAVPTDRLDDSTPCSDWTVTQVLLHAAGDQHGWASVVGSSPQPAYDPFAPPTQLIGTVDELIEPAIAAASAAWARVDAKAESVPTPLPSVPRLPAELAAAACALDAAVHAWDVAVATGQGSPLHPELAAQLMPAAQAVAEPLRGFAYAPALPQQQSDDAAAALLRYVGRDPDWTA
ncbi:MAG TPA: TIGR03086 family metal-binding protein [Jatrophihabitantaceae bacterium]|nr:TIGR03086 family metal-binding protein [Jatrophihabitantaceae bacterium]